MTVTITVWHTPGSPRYQSLTEDPSKTQPDRQGAVSAPAGSPAADPDDGEGPGGNGGDGPGEGLLGESRPAGPGERAEERHDSLLSVHVPCTCGWMDEGYCLRINACSITLYYSDTPGWDTDTMLMI